MKSEFETLLDKFTGATKQQYGNYAFATGYLTVLANSMYNNLSKHQQEMIARDIKRATEYSQEAVKEV